MGSKQEKQAKYSLKKVGNRMLPRECPFVFILDFIRRTYNQRNKIVTLIGHQEPQL